MNAQTNSTNFQQFVNENKGKLITFKHNDTLVSKVVVDVCGEYFTGKINESDAKIDGFYYFSDCKMVESKHPLIEVLEKYRFVILRQINTGADFMIEYISNNGDRFNAKNLAIRYNNSFLSTKLMDIGEVWVIVDGKYTSVWKTADTIARDGDSKYGALEKVLKENKGCNVATKSGTWCNFNFHSLNNGFVIGDCLNTPTAIMANNIVSVDSKDGKRVYTSDEILPEPSQPMDKLSSYFDSHNKVSNACEKVNNSLDKLNKAFDKVFPTIDKTPKDGHFEDSYPNGKLKRMGEYKNGKLHGKYQEWSDTGNLSLYAEYNEGKLNGKYILYYEDGTINCYMIVKDGVNVEVKVGNNDDFHRPCRLSPFLREFLGIKEDIKCVRKDITERVIEYCMQHVNPKDKTKIIPDGKIYHLIGGEFGKQITFFELQKILDKHFLKDELTEKEKDIIETLKNNKCVTIKSKSDFVWENFIFNSIEGRFVLGDCYGNPTSINLNNIATVEPSQNSSDIDKEQYNLIKEHAKMFIDIFYDLGGYAPNTINKFLNKLLFIKERDFSLEELKEFRASFEELRDELLPQIKNTFKKDPTFQALLKRFVEFSLLILTENSIHKDHIKTLLININNKMSVAGRKEYNEWFSKENKEDDKHKQEYKLTVEHADKFLDLKEELRVFSPLNSPDFIYTLLQIKTNPEFSLERLTKFQKAWDCLKESLKIQLKYFKEPKVLSLLKRFFETTILISPDNESCKEVLEKINNIIKQTNNEQKNIKYRGKPKTIVVMNEFKHANGKDYVMVKDVTDNDKTKTLFKEYIEWM